MNLEIIDLLLLGVIVCLEVWYVIRDNRKEKIEAIIQDRHLKLLQDVHKVLVEQKEVLEDSQAELADMRDQLVEPEEQLSVEGQSDEERKN